MIKKLPAILFTLALALAPARADFSGGRLMGFGGIIGTPPPIAVTFLTSAVSTTDATAYTFSSQTLGTAASNRQIVVGVGGTTTAQTISTLTVDSVSASSVINAADGGSGTSNRAYLQISANPSNTTGNVVVTWSGAISNCGIALYRMVDALSPIATETHSENSPVSDALSYSQTIPTGGAGIGYVYASHTSLVRTWTWTNLTENMDQNVENAGGQRACHSSALSSTAGTLTRTVTASASLSGFAQVLVGASWR